jgi:hypothetical protein
MGNSQFKGNDRSVDEIADDVGESKGDVRDLVSMSYHEKLVCDGYEFDGLAEDSEDTEMMVDNYGVSVEVGSIERYAMISVNLVPEVLAEVGCSDSLPNSVAFYIKKRD